MGNLLGGYKPVGRHAVRHGKDDLMWIHRTKGDVLEARGYSRGNSNRIKELLETGEVVEGICFGKKVYIDIPMAKHWKDNLITNK